MYNAHDKVMHTKCCSLDQRPEHIGTISEQLTKQITGSQQQHFSEWKVNRFIEKMQFSIESERNHKTRRWLVLLSEDHTNTN